MKRLFFSLIVAGTMVGGAWAQESATKRQNSSNSGPAAELPKFDLNFEGGGPQQLVDKIREALVSRAREDPRVDPLNVIIPEEHKNVILPPMRMRAVDAKQLFEALELANMKTVQFVTGEV